MMDPSSNGMRQHQNLAQGKPIPDEGTGDGKGAFGVESMHDRSVMRGDGKGRASPLADHERGAVHPHGRGAGDMHAQAQPDHGPHLHSSPMPRQSKGIYHRGQNGGRGR